MAYSIQSFYMANFCFFFPHVSVYLFCQNNLFWFYDKSICPKEEGKNKGKGTIFASSFPMIMFCHMLSHIRSFIPMCKFLVMYRMLPILKDKHGKQWREKLPSAPKFPSVPWPAYVTSNLGSSTTSATSTTTTMTTDSGTHTGSVSTPAQVQTTKPGKYSHPQQWFNKKSSFFVKRM